MPTTVKLGGVYRHYKHAHLYRVLEVGYVERNGAAGEAHVVYQRCDVEGVVLPEERVWIRPLREWDELVEVNSVKGSGYGYKMRRFVLAGD